MPWTLGAACVLVVLAWITFTYTPIVKTGATRLLWPQTSSSWPARTSLITMVNTQQDVVYARGGDFVLRAKNTTPGAPSGAIWATYRTHNGGEYTDWEEVLMTDQGGGVHERVVTPDGSRLEFYFSTVDAHTETQAITLQERPVITNINLEIHPPKSLADDIEKRNYLYNETSPHFSKVEPPVLHGSLIELNLRATSDIPIPPTGSESAWCSENLGFSPGDSVDVSSAEDKSINIRWLFNNPSHIMIHPIDANGLRPVDPVVIDITSTYDMEPDVTLVHPLSDRSVLKSAQLQLEATATDDIRLSNIGFRVVPTRSDEVGPTQMTWSHQEPTRGVSGEYNTELDISNLNPSVGTIYTVQASASDNHMLDDGLKRRVFSDAIHIQIVDDSRFLTMVRQRLANIRESIRLIDEQQGDLEQIVRLGVWTTEDVNNQTNLTNQIEDQMAKLGVVSDEMDTNNSTDETVPAIIEFVHGALNRAVHHSNLTTQSMRGEEPSIVLLNQEEVRFELQGVVEILGDDESTWLVSREIERLLEAQRLLLMRTVAVSTANPGLEITNMTPDQLEMINSCSEDQSAITMGINSLVEDLRTLSQALTAVGDVEAGLYEEATERVVQSNLGNVSERSAREIGIGKLGTSVDSQQFIINTLVSIYDILSNESTLSTKELVRRLEELRDSIQRLVDTQKSELEILNSLNPGTPCKSCATTMMQLRTATLSVTKRVDRTEVTMRQVVQDMEQAALQQSRAVTGLRSQDFEKQAIVTHETKSLFHLNTALSTVIQQAEQVQNESNNTMQRELASAYDQLADREATLFVSTKSLMDEPGGRRARFEGRRQARSQESIRIDLTSLVSSQPYVANSPIFQYTHRHIDSVAQLVVHDLEVGDINTETLDHERLIIQMLRNLARSIETSGSDQQFNPGSGQSGGGGSEAQDDEQVAPPLAELKLLRFMQTSLLDETKRLNNRLVVGEPIDPEAQNQLADQQRALAGVATSILERLDGVEGPESSNSVGDEGVTNTIQYQQVPVNNPQKQESSPGDLPDLDELLGTGGTPGDVPSHVDVVDDGSSPLRIAASQMEAVAIYLSSAQTGLETQRLQADIIYQLDLMIELAQREQSSSQGGSGGSNPSPEGESDVGVSDVDQGADAGESSSPEEGPLIQTVELDPLLGGALDGSGSEWGNLPPRIRDLLRQGKQEEYSTIYERLTAEYYRRLAEDANDD